MPLLLIFSLPSWWLLLHIPGSWRIYRYLEPQAPDISPSVFCLYWWSIPDLLQIIISDFLLLSNEDSWSHAMSWTFLLGLEKHLTSLFTFIIFSMSSVLVKPRPPWCIPMYRNYLVPSSEASLPSIAVSLFLHQVADTKFCQLCRHLGGVGSWSGRRCSAYLSSAILWELSCRWFLLPTP